MREGGREGEGGRKEERERGRKGRREGGGGRGKEQAAEEKKGLFWGQNVFSLWEVKGKGFYYEDCLFCVHIGEWKWRCAQLTLLMIDQKIPYWLIKIMFLGKDETAIRSGIKSRFGIMGF